MGSFARQPGYQRKLTPFVDEFCKIYPSVNTHLQTLASRFGYGNGLNYTKSEAQSLKETDSTTGTGDVATFTGIFTSTEGRQQNEGAPVLQMYDFISTMDDLDRKCTDLHQQLSVQSADRSALRKSLAASDMRPWGFHVTFPDLYQTTSDGYRVCIGQQLGEELIYDPYRVIAGKKTKPLLGLYNRWRGPYRKKTEYELAQDEAHLLQYTTLRDLYSLTQGLFRCYVTFSHDITDTFFDLPSNKTLQTATELYGGGRGVVRAPYYINKFNEAGRVFDEKFSPYFGTENKGNAITNALMLLQAKDTNLSHYKDNRFHAEFARNGLPRDAPHPQYAYGWKEPIASPASAGTDAETTVASTPSPFQNDGGAIGWRLVSTKGKVKTITAEMINDAMRTLEFHPIYVCPDLGKAFERSGLRRYFSQRVQQLQSNNIAEQQLNFGTFSPLGSQDPLQYKKLSTSDGRISCYPGTTPTFTKGPTGPLEPLNNVYSYDAASGKYIVGREYVQNVNCVKSFSASAFLVDKKSESERARSHRFIPVEYYNPGGGTVEFFVDADSKPAHLLQYFYAKSDKGKSHV
jgi:hypothetical protein